MITVVKIGGNVIYKPNQLSQFLNDFSAITGPKILVHGGGKLASRMAKDLNIETQMINGRRVTSPEMLDIAVMVYAGLINKHIVAGLASMNVDAIGLCGADIHSITSIKRSPEPIDYGEVGDIINVNSSAIKKLLDCNFTPVICAITSTSEGKLLNTNADTVATRVAMAMSSEAETELVFCFEKNGVLANVDDDNSVIELITPHTVDKLIADKIIVDGMVPKVTNAIDAICNSHLNSITIKSSARLRDNSGTHICKDNT